MKFKKNTVKSPQLQLLRRLSTGSKASNFKRNKSFRSSVRLINKFRNQANFYITSNANSTQYTLNEEIENISNDKNKSMSEAANFNFDLDQNIDSNNYRYCKANDSDNLFEDLEKKLSLSTDVTQKSQSSSNKQQGSGLLSVESDFFNAYENPTFIDSSLDSSTNSFFHEDLNSSHKSCDCDLKGPTSDSDIDKTNKKPDKNELTVVVDSLQTCKTHAWCTCITKKTKVNEKWCLTKEPLKHCIHFKTSENPFVRTKSLILSSKECKKLELTRKYLKPKTTDNICELHSESQNYNFSCKGLSKNHAKVSTFGLKTQKNKQRSSSKLKLRPLQGMEFLEGFGKKKHQLKNQQINNSLSHVNPIKAQSPLDIHLHALFTAVENGNIDKAKSILESTEVDVNSVNNDNLTLLDMAILSNNRSLAKMLISFGAKEGNHFKSAEMLGNHLSTLLTDAESHIQELNGGMSTSGLGYRNSSGFLEPIANNVHRGSFTSQHNNLTGCGGSSEDKQLVLWERRAKALRKMLIGFDQARPPDIPFVAAVEVDSPTAVIVRILDSETQESALCTKFKVQWSFCEDFAIICGECEIFDMTRKECRIDGLNQGRKYFFRAASGNLKGYSRFKSTVPESITPSSWRDVDGRTTRISGRLEELDSLLNDVRGSEYSLEATAMQRRNHKKKTTIKQLFTATSKFQKNLRRGIFLSCVFYYEEKVLVTNEDFLPVIEIDEIYPSCVYSDFHWFMKVACSWGDVKSLKQDMEKNHSNMTNHFRMKLLHAAAQMQTALCTLELGKFYHKPIRDAHGTLVFSTVNCVKSPKQVSVLNSRWLPLSKISKKFVTHDDSNVADILMASIHDQITYHQVSSTKLPRGLYLGYLKMQSSVDSIQVVVPTKSPNILPHCKIRENSHVSAEEWEYLKRVGRVQGSSSSDIEDRDNVMSNEVEGSEQQRAFVDAVAAAAKRLFAYMDISAEESLAHRLYDVEVIELDGDVSFLVVVPPAEVACSVPGTREILLQRGDLLSLSVQVFEMVHLGTYQKDVTRRYSRLSCILELDTAQAQHNQREAFSNSELTVAKDKLARLQQIQTQANTLWKGLRWLIDLITFARDRTSSSSFQIAGTSNAGPNVGISIKRLLSLERNRGTNQTSGNLKRSLLQIPPRDPKLVKSSPGRGSWPGPGVSNSTCTSTTNLLTTELSKSEQQLSLGPYPRKGSNSSNCSSASEPYATTSSGFLMPAPPVPSRLGSSRSEDALLLACKPSHRHSSMQQHRSHAKGSSSASTSPLKSNSRTKVDSEVALGSDEFVKPLRPVKLYKQQLAASVAAISDSCPTSGKFASEENKQANAESESTTAARSASLPGILQVYAAYETGLASGTSLKLHVTGRTTAREVVDLVVRQLNMAVRLKGLDGPIYEQEELQNFCLVAVIGARERCLRDDFKPLQLQNPWKKGRLYVRQKHDVLAALEHSSKHTTFL